MTTPSALSVISAEGYFGTRGVNSFAPNEVEPSYRSTIFNLNINAAIQLTGILSMFPKITEQNSEFFWWERKHANRQGACAVYTTQDLGTAYGTSDTTTAGTVVYIKMALALAKHLRPRHLLRLTKNYNFAYDTQGEVMSVVENGDRSYAAVRLFKATTAGWLAAIDYCAVAGNINPDGSMVPQGTSTQKVRRTNHLQTFRNPIRMTRRAMNQKLRTVKNPMADEREQIGVQHLEDWEQAMIFGEMDDGNITVDGEPQTAMQGIIPCLREHAPGNIADFYNDAGDWSGKAWIADGAAWMDYHARRIFHYGPKERTVLCGSGFLSGIDALAKANNNVMLQQGATSVGLGVTVWKTPHGTLYFKDHAAFTDDPTYAYAGLCIVPDYLRQVISEEPSFRVLTEADKAKRAGIEGYDGAVEEWFGEGSLMMNGPEAFYLLGGVGLDNVNYTPVV